jgi:hypothetical protein
MRGQDLRCTCGDSECPSCGVAQGTLDESDINEETQARPEDVTPLPPPEPPELAPGEVAVLVGQTVLTDAGDLIDDATGEVLEDAPGWDQATKQIATVEGLNWVGHVLRDAHVTMAENERLAADEIADLERRLSVARLRLERAQKPLKDRIAFFESRVVAFAQTHRTELLRGLRKDAKSRLLPSGLRVGWKKAGGEYRWRQDMTPKEAKERLAEWALRQHSAMDPDDTRILVTEEKRYVPDRDAIEEYVGTLEGFTVPDGLEWVPEHEDVTIKVGEEK